ncbi:hypothetical protein MD484_g2805, partial [Candolleomyces efflorescens]
MAGDDLEDDFVADDLVALSEDEGVNVDFEEESNDNDNDNAHAEVAPDPSDSAILKKRKRREKEKEKKAKKRKLAMVNEPIPQGSIAAQSPEDLEAYLATAQKKSFKDMSDFELDDIRIPASAIADTTAWKGPRTLDQLVDFIMKILPTLHTRLGQRPKSNGAPTLLFITGAALRVADVARILRDKRLRGEKGGDIAKLFAKHIKLSEHVDYLRRTRVGAAPGTPVADAATRRLTGSLSVSALSHIILDVTFKDSKNRNLLDIPETRDEVFKTVLGCPAVMKAVKDGKTKIVLL